MSYPFPVHSFIIFKLFQILAVLSGQYRALRRIACPRCSDSGVRVKFFALALLSERLEQALRRISSCFVLRSLKEIDFMLATFLLPPHQALRSSHSASAKREWHTSDWWRKRKGPWEPERSDSFLLLAFLCSQILIEMDRRRRLDTIQVSWRVSCVVLTVLEIQSIPEELTGS